MVERGFFDRRYTFPGYAFILWVLLMNLKIVLLFYSEPLEGVVGFFGVFLGFVAILSGAPIGFLVSQFWYLYFNYRKNKYPRVVEIQTFLFENLEMSGDVDSRRKELAAIQDHITGTWPVKEDENYLTRRYDLLNLIGSTGVAIVAGWGAGALLRWGIVELGIRCIYEKLMPSDLFLLIDVTVLFITLILVVILCGIYVQIREEHFSMIEFLVWSFVNEVHVKIQRKKETVDLYKGYSGIEKRTDLKAQDEKTE